MRGSHLAAAMAAILAPSCPLAKGSSDPHSPTRDAPSRWSIRSDLVFNGQEPTPEFASLVRALAAPADDQGSPVDAEELRRLLGDPRAVEVYGDELLKYATPRSREIQRAEHRSFARAFMQPAKIQEGVAFLVQHAAELDRARDRYGVAPQDVVGVLMWESSLGKVTGTFRVFNVYLGQMLYLEQAFAASERTLGLTLSGAEREAHLARLARLGRNAERYLAALLRSCKAKGVDPLSVTGSWGGAIGFPQFMPTSLPFAVDGDGDGRIDLYAFPDAISSIANFLARHGYGVSRAHALHAYNPESEYVRGVQLYADEIARKYASKGGRRPGRSPRHPDAERRPSRDER